MRDYLQITQDLKDNPKCWLVTGVAGFIGSHLCETLLNLGQKVVGLDNLSACGMRNIDIVKNNIPVPLWENFTFIEGDICRISDCQKALQDVDIILHNAALGSVQLSIENPDLVHAVNVEGTENLLRCANESGTVSRIVFSSSSAAYGDYTIKPNQEDQPLKPLSPYADGKIACENLLQQSAISSMALRYFNIYGPRQDPQGAYAAVIPKWIDAMVAQDEVLLFGDGSAIRDFCYIDDVVQANILAALHDDPENLNHVYNIGSGQHMSLLTLLKALKAHLDYPYEPIMQEARSGDIHISCADISKAQKALGFTPATSFEAGIDATVQFFKQGKSVQ